MSTARLDAELVRRGLARARGQAEEMVRAGRVSVDGRPATKPALRVSATAAIEVVPRSDDDWVGRGALKLSGLLDDLAGLALQAASPPDQAHDSVVAAPARPAAPSAARDATKQPGAETPTGSPALVVGTGSTASPAAGSAGGPRILGRRCLDAGASTGGFTQVLLDRGAREVIAVDVGHGQLAQRLRDDPRVQERSGTSVRGLRPEDVGGPVDLLVADLSFISLQTVLPDLAGLVRPGGDLLLLVKPQFEVGRRRLGSGGVVRDLGLRAEAVLTVARAALDLGLEVRAVRASRWPGPGGNVEYFLWLTLPSGLSDEGGTVVPLDRAAAVRPEALAAVVRAAVEEGPS